MPANERVRVEKQFVIQRCFYCPLPDAIGRIGKQHFMLSTHALAPRAHKQCRFYVKICCPKRQVKGRVLPQERVACGGGNGKSYDFHLLNQSVEAYNNVEQDNKILEKSLLDTLRRFASEWCMMDKHQF